MFRRLWESVRASRGAAPADGRGRGRRRIEIAGEVPLIYAVGDVHGCLDLLEGLEARIVADAGPGPGGKLIIMLGDYVDRGPRSAAVIDHLLGDPPPGFERICLCGNHDDLMLAFLDDPVANAHWLDFGGDATLASYGVDLDHLKRIGTRKSALVETVRYAVPQEHMRFLEGLPVMVTTPGHVFVHAGLRPGVALADQAEQDLMWIREDFLAAGAGWEGQVVHGHSPHPEPLVGPGRLGVDTGAYLYGRLTAARIAGGEVSLLSVAG